MITEEVLSSAIFALREEKNMCLFRDLSLREEKNMCFFSYPWA
jgi:hypothetical protein